MKKLLVAGVLALGVGVMVVPSSAGAGTGTPVRIAQMITYDADAPFPLTVCVDGAEVEADVEVGTILDPIMLTPGDHLVEFIQGPCGDDPFADGTISVGSTPLVAMGYWGNQVRSVVAFPDTVPECLDAGTARITLRNGAGLSAPDAVDFWATRSGGASTRYIAGVSTGAEGTGIFPAGAYTAGEIARSDNAAQVVDLGPTNLAEGSVLAMYLYGGNDGDVGYALDGDDVPICQVPTTTTTRPTSTTTTAAAAAVVTPRFTG